jgi:lipid II:glycine glycyltransferase (peptidoglycan interpeptide bridge formation enzyme)
VGMPASAETRQETGNPASAELCTSSVSMVDPLTYSGWDQLLTSRPEASFFHGSAWARVLHSTYGHRPFYFGILENGRLVSLLPFMEVSSWLSGRRAVSLPFTDFCVPIEAPGQGSARLYEHAIEEGCKRRWRWLECRASNSAFGGATPSLAFLGHIVDLKGGQEQMFQNLESAVRRGIRKAEKAGLRIEFSRSAEAMQTFFTLHCGTRRRHGVPPQPLRFFQNIVRYVLGEDRGFVATAYLDNRPVASAVFFHQQKDSIYKFGASDYAFQHLRPNNLVMWEAIKRLAEAGCTHLHLGRTSMGNEGLRRFKLGFGAREEQINYFKYDFRTCSVVAEKDKAEGWFNPFFRHLPLCLSRLAGRVLYPHLS